MNNFRVFRSLLVRSRSHQRVCSPRCLSSSSGGGGQSGMTTYDSLSSTYKTITHCNENNKGAAWYVCGPTVYDSAHLGHGRTYVLLDIIRRVALHMHNNGTPRPLYVMNITDVDDKIIQRSQEIAALEKGEQPTSADPIALARYYEREFWKDMDHLNVMRPDVICRVSEHVESTIVPYIQQIVDGGMAYVIHEDESQNGSVYFDVRAFEEKSNGLTRYGKLAPDVASTNFFSWDDPNNDENQNDHSQQRKKRDPRDFALWKYRPRQSDSTSVEPEVVSYQSPFGPGRPGWHVECSAMIEKLSRDFASTHDFLVHAGGVDLKFPHHSNEIAQAEAFQLTRSTNHGSSWKEWIPHWMHTGHLHVKGRKMSKSLKNFVTIREMLNISDDNEANRQADNEWSSPADDFRLWCLGISGSYRGPATYAKDRIEEARAIREKWVKFMIEGQKWVDLRANSELEHVRFWRPLDNELFRTVTQSRIKCLKALVGHTSRDGGSCDLDGATFVKEITVITETGMKYLDQSKSDPISCPGEPLKLTLSSLRELLGLVGFTDKTFNAGNHNITSGQFGIAPLNNELIDKVVAFRTAIRSSAINGIKNKDGISAAKEALRLCDELRDDIMPTFGVEVLDGKVGEGWRSCSPNKKESDKNI